MKNIREQLNTKLLLPSSGCSSNFPCPIPSSWEANSNPSIFEDATITQGFISCVETFYHHDEDKQDQAINTELDKFRNREGPFNKKLAKTCEKFNYNPDRGNSYSHITWLLVCYTVCYLHLL